jgi:hypothetical protein
MSKDISNVALAGAVLLTSEAWKRIRDYLKLSNAVFNDDLKTNNKITKGAVQDAINKMDEKKREALITDLEKQNQNYEVRDNIVGILKESKIARGSSQGKKKPEAIKPEEKEKDREEPTPALASQMADRKREEEEDKRYQAYLAEVEAEIREQAEQQAEVDRLQREMKRKEAEDMRLALTMPSGLNVFEGIPTGGQKEEERKEKAKLRKEAISATKNIMSIIKKKTIGEIRRKGAEKKRAAVPKKPTTAQRIEDLKAEVLSSAEQSRLRNVSIAEDIRQVGAGVQEIKDTIKMIQSDPQLRTIERKIRTRLTRNDVNNFEGIGGINKADIKSIIDTIPEAYRGILGPAVNGLLGDDLNLNQVVAGLVGIGVSVSSGSLMAGSVARTTIPQILDAFNIDLNDILIGPPEEKQKEKEREIKTTPSIGAPPGSSAPPLGPPPGSAALRLTDNIRDYTALDQSVLSQFIQLYDLTRTAIGQGLDYSGARQPTEDEIRRGVLAGGLSGVASAGLSSGSAMTAVSSVIPGAFVGGVAAGLTAGNMQRLSLAIESKLSDAGVDITPERREQIRRVVQIVPPSIVGAYLGYNPTNSEPIGTGIVTGGGITERKLIATPGVIEQTQVQENQQKSGNKIWQPKSISPTTDILNESKQERYADDVEFIAFNYIAPTSEGGYGTVDTNPLKRSQATADALRYTDAGVYVPYLLWNQINNTNEMKPKQLEKLALGVELPPMEFIAQDNEETFEEVARLQFPNNELMAIEFLSPYADFSNVENFWMTNPDNMLFTINK